MATIKSPFGEHEGTLTDHRFGGDHWKLEFANGFGASVIRFSDGEFLHSYGGDRGLWELGVLGPNGRLTYETPITDDVIGDLSEAEVAETLDRIAALPVAEAVSA